MKKKIYSPELVVYQSQVTSLYSIFNRVSGVFLILLWLSLFLLVKVFKYLIFNYTFYLLNFYLFFTFNFIINSILVFLLFNFLFHLFAGIRHLIWDTGRLLNLEEVGYTSVILVLLVVFSIFLILI